MITLKNLSKVYQSDAGSIPALENINLTVEKGEIFGIIGKSGAGKSTLVRCMNMLERPTEGEVLVAGQDLTVLTEKQLRDARKQISMIFQHFNLLSSRTVFDNVAFPLELAGKSKNEIKNAVLPLLELVGLADKANQYPSQLSGGQKQRVGIARALASQPKVLLCDEATSALDPQTTHSILQLLKSINKKLDLTIVLITHEMHVIKEICHRVAVIENGHIVEEGPVLDIFTNPQSATTRDFISTLEQNNLDELLSDREIRQESVTGDNLLVKLSFIGASAEEPIIASLIRRFNVDASILYGNIDHIDSTPYGTLVIELSGVKENIESALKYLQTKDLGIEVIGYVARNTSIAG
ncbi:MAG: methionine ABC transporter ATP-binding protein [Sporomusaceae bacterium]|nr:methionine ABC transporter ATP-binding protein [Sporomusaceae bacterium]